MVCSKNVHGVHSLSAFNGPDMDILHSNNGDALWKALFDARFQPLDEEVCVCVCFVLLCLLCIVFVLLCDPQWGFDSSAIMFWHGWSHMHMILCYNYFSMYISTDLYLRPPPSSLQLVVEVNVWGNKLVAILYLECWLILGSQQEVCVASMAMHPCH